MQNAQLIVHLSKFCVQLYVSHDQAAFGCLHAAQNEIVYTPALACTVPISEAPIFRPRHACEMRFDRRRNITSYPGNAECQVESDSPSR